MNQLVVDLLKEFKNREVRYVHWKSNLNINLALNGDDDLDILVLKEDKDKVFNIFKKFSFIRAYSEKDKWQKYIFHYIGYDIYSNKLIHIHLHYELELGFDFDKRFLLPISNKYLDNRILFKRIVYLPQIEKEYVILVIRLILKNSLLPFILQSPIKLIKTLFTSTSNIINGQAYKEFLDLKQKANSKKVSDVITTTFPFLTFEEFTFFEDIIEQNNTYISFFKVGKRLYKILRRYKTNSDINSFYVSLLRVYNTKFRILKNKIFGINSKGTKLPENGGRILAFIGGDGAGKSTNINEVNKVLTKHFKTNVIHIGRPSITFYGFIYKILQKFFKVISYEDLSKAFYYLGIARDRLASFKRARKLREKGEIVLMDRLPYNSITTMDCPRIHNIERSNNIYKWLSDKEKKYYAKIRGVDLMLIFLLDPKIALMRRPDDDSKQLLIRSGNIWNINWENEKGNIVVIDASEPLPVVIQRVNTAIWNELNRKLDRIEIIGLPGSGKTTLIRQIGLKRNIVSNIGLKTYPTYTIYVILKELPQLIRIFLAKKKYNYILNYILFNILLILMKRSVDKGIKNIYPPSNFVFDQGPVYMMAFGIKEGLWRSNNFEKKAIKIITEFIDKIYFLDAPYEVLWERVVSRNQYHRTRETGFDMFSLFCNEYIDSFSSFFKKVHIEKINTNDLAINEILEKYFLNE